MDKRKKKNQTEYKDLFDPQGAAANATGAIVVGSVLCIPFLGFAPLLVTLGGIAAAGYTVKTMANRIERKEDSEA